MVVGPSHTGQYQHFLVCFDVCVTTVLFSFSTSFLCSLLYYSPKQPADFVYISLLATEISHCYCRNSALISFNLIKTKSCLGLEIVLFLINCLIVIGWYFIIVILFFVLDKCWWCQWCLQWRLFHFFSSWLWLFHVIGEWITARKCVCVM